MIMFFPMGILPWDPYIPTAVQDNKKIVFTKPKKDFIMFKFVKDARRRSVETVLGAFGSTERTTDEEFDSREATFKRMMADMGDCKC